MKKENASLGSDGESRLAGAWAFMQSGSEMGLEKAVWTGLEGSRMPRHRLWHQRHGMVRLRQTNPRQTEEVLSAVYGVDPSRESLATGQTLPGNLILIVTQSILSDRETEAVCAHGCTAQK